MSKGAVLVDWRDDVVVLTLNRPERRNAVDLASLQLIREAQVEAEKRNVRALVLTGSAPAFCAGADLAGVREEVFHEMLNEVLRGFTQLPCVTIAAIDGPALGAGSQLAAACDLRIATPKSKFGVPAAKLGLAVDSWTVERIGREAGWSAARYMLLSAEAIHADELVGGFVHRLGTLDDAMTWAHEMSLLAPLTIKAHKMALERLSGADISLEAVEHARLAAWASNDANEGRQAFLEKRQPNFLGS
jgi:enoyl-CoA hydratase